MSPLQGQIDYIFFFYGLSFLILAAICLSILRDAEDSAAWRWLGFFGLSHGLSEWLDLAALLRPDSLTLTGLQIVLLAISFLCLLEFARRLQRLVEGKSPGAWIHLPLGAAACLGAAWGAAGLAVTIRYALGLPAGLYAAWRLLRASKRPGSRRLPLLLIGVTLGLYALAAGLVVPASSLGPSRWINAEAFSSAFGFPIQLVRALLALALAASVWAFSQNLLVAERRGGADSPRQRRIAWIALAAFCLILAGGWAFTDRFLGARAQEDLATDIRNDNMILYYRLADALLTAEQNVTAMAEAPWIVDGARNRTPEDLVRGNSVLDRYRNAYDLSVCYLLDPRGTTIASSNRGAPDSFVGKSYAFRPYFKEAAEGRGGRYFALGATSNEPGYFASRPVREASGVLLGVAVVKRGLSFLEREMGILGDTFLVSPEGIAFISSQRELRFSSLWPVPGEAQAALRESKQFGALSPSSAPAWPSELLDGARISRQGETYLVSRLPLKQAGWSLIHMRSMRPVRFARLMGMLVSLLFCLTTLGFSMLLLRGVAQHEAVLQLLRLRGEVKTLTGILPICASCKKVRDDKGYWKQVESYVSSHTEATFTHGVCPDCVKKLFPEDGGAEG